MLVWVTPARAAFPFSRSPASGPSGTAINVSGSLCANPLGLVASVRVTLSGTSASTTISPSGASWSGTLTVPNGTSAGSHTLTAQCLLAGIPVDSSTAGFEVVAAQTPSTSPSTNTTQLAGATQTNASNTTSGSTDSGSADGTESASQPIGSNGATDTGTEATKSDAATGDVAAAAASSPQLAGRDGRDLFAWWVLLILLGTAIASWLWYRRRRSSPEDTTSVLPSEIDLASLDEEIAENAQNLGVPGIAARAREIGKEH